jgi:hypothetical protein
MQMRSATKTPKQVKVLNHASLIVVRIKRIPEDQNFATELSTPKVEGPEFAFGYICAPLACFFVAYRDGRIISQTDISLEFDELNNSFTRRRDLRAMQRDEWDDQVRQLLARALLPTAVAIVEEADRVVALSDLEKIELRDLFATRQDMFGCGDPYNHSTCESLSIPYLGGGFSLNPSEMWPNSWVREFGSQQDEVCKFKQFGKGSSTSGADSRASLLLDDSYAGGLILNGSEVCSFDSLASGIRVKLEGEVGVATWKENYSRRGFYVGAYGGLESEWVAARRRTVLTSQDA